MSLLKTSPWLVLWKLKAISNSEAKERLFKSLYGGMDYAEFRKCCESFATIIEGDLNAEGLQYLKQHMDDGDRVIILSASIGDWIRPWAESYGIREVISTETEVTPQGILTGKFSTPNCHGREKVARIKSLLHDRGGREIYAYGDSPSDRYILDFADNGIIVNSK